MISIEPAWRGLCYLPAREDIMRSIARDNLSLDIVALTRIVAIGVTWIVTLAAAASLWACSNDLDQPEGSQEGTATEELVVDDADDSFSCTTNLSEHHDPCLEGGCCGFPLSDARPGQIPGADGGRESAQCGYGTLEEGDDDTATGAVCACSFFGQYRVSCITDYETGQVECSCTAL
jgi:hypothetical protein